VICQPRARVLGVRPQPVLAAVSSARTRWSPLSDRCLRQAIHHHVPPRAKLSRTV